ncbi:hypothetical protein [Paenibacillus sp. DYY-L-2]|uniref:hypothetical protein n=1 Tax=Paenibacillus sp. DYY-L-2 TaxID=3447013 RepID=UPI003F4FBBE7
MINLAPQNAVYYECHFFGFTSPKPVVTTIRNLNDVQKVHQHILAQTESKSGMFNLEISGYLVWNGKVYSFDKTHSDRAVQVTITRLKNLMYDQVRQHFEIFETTEIPGTPTCIVGMC